MGGRGFCVKIELDLQAVTCPGVWLCPNGKVALRLNALNSRIESERLTPAFPLLYRDKFRFDKLFTGVGTLAELQSRLEDEYVYAELVQWSSPKCASTVLATFETNLADLLYPASCSKGLPAGSEVDLLMEPTKYFPGILAPKIEVSTRTTIEEATGIFKTNSGSRMINPKTINSKMGNCAHRKRPSKGIMRQRKVCHTQANTDEQERPIVQRRLSTCGTCFFPSDCANNLSQSRYENCRREKKETRDVANDDGTSKNRETSSRSSSHALQSCPVCSRYKCYFLHDNDERAKASNCHEEDNPEVIERMHESTKCPRHSRCDGENNENNRARSETREDSSNDSSSSLRLKAREIERQDGKWTNAVGDARIVDYFNRDNEEDRQGFYKNLEKFYKRMYKQAKIRAQEIDCL